MSDKARAVRAETIVVYARLDAADHAELRRREAATGATVAAQIRIIVRDALRRKGKIR